jgi:oxygen-independent coproporphyrinogen-3 oxidase
MMNKIGLYVHVPFCRGKCPYCDFYSVNYDKAAAESYAKAVVRNIIAYGGSFDTVYFGGGTPILLADRLGEILSAADIESGAEITAECNPCEMNPRTLETLLKAGVNRISVGVQSLDDSELSALGRRHDAKTAEQAILAAKSAGFDNISADLMLAVPNQTYDSLSRTIDRLCKLPLTHISAYMLKIEPNTAFGKNTPVLPDEDLTADLYLQTVRSFAENSFGQYEISNFAKKGFECRHNLKYWRREEYLGIGPAAHSFLGGRRFYVNRDLAAFIRSERQEEQTEDENINEYEERVMLGLRLNEGISEELWKPLEGKLKLVPKNYYTLKNGRLSLTAEGFLVSNEIISLLLADS